MLRIFIKINITEVVLQGMSKFKASIIDVASKKCLDRVVLGTLKYTIDGMLYKFRNIKK